MDSENGWRQRQGGASSTDAARRAENASQWCERRRPVAPIKNSARIGEVLKTGARINGRHVGLAYLKRENDGGARLAVLAPKRAGGAVNRNRIRRILREQARLSTGFQTMPLDIVLYWKGDLSPETRQQARSETRKLLSALKH
jgi:ribonuclease P protein component